MIALLFLCAIVILFAYHLWCTHSGTFIYWTKCGILQIPASLPIIGHMATVFLLLEHFSAMVSRYYRMFNKYSLVGFNDAGTPALIIREPELAKIILQTNFASFDENKLALDPKLDPLLCKNPFFSKGEIWSSSRKALSHAFSSVGMMTIADGVCSACEKLSNFLDKRVDKHGEMEVELKDFFSRFTGEVVANVGFGVEGYCFTQEYHPTSFRKLGKDIFGGSILTGVQQVFILYFPAISRFFKWRFVPKQVDSLFRDLVRRVTESRKSESVHREDFFQFIVDRAPSEEDAVARLFTLFLDGYETTSITLGFVGHQLATHPHIQEKLRQEVADVLAKHGDRVSIESLKEMTYMDQVINESMRMYPSVPMLSKVCTKEFELTTSDGTSCHLKPGTEVIIPVHALHNDPKYWNHPEVFDPERFAAARKNEVPKFVFLPFGEGPRICVGMRLGLLQTKAALATFLKNYSLESSPRTKLPLKTKPTSFLLCPVGGLWATIRHV